MGPLQSAHATKTRMHAQWHKDVCLDIENIWLVVPTCLKTGSSFSREACKKHVTYICYICIYISKQTIKLETFGTMMFRTLGTVIAFSPEPPLVSHWLVATVLETSPHVASRWKVDPSFHWRTESSCCKTNLNLKSFSHAAIYQGMQDAIRLLHNFCLLAVLNPMRSNETINSSPESASGSRQPQYYITTLLSNVLTWSKAQWAGLGRQRQPSGPAWQLSTQLTSVIPIYKHMLTYYKCNTWILHQCKTHITNVILEY